MIDNKMDYLVGIWCEVLEVVEGWEFCLIDMWENMFGIMGYFGVWILDELYGYDVVGLEG